MVTQSLVEYGDQGLVRMQVYKYRPNSPYRRSKTKNSNGLSSHIIQTCTLKIRPWNNIMCTPIRIR